MSERDFTRLPRLDDREDADELAVTRGGRTYRTRTGTLLDDLDPGEKVANAEVDAVGSTDADLDALSAVAQAGLDDEKFTTVRKVVRLLARVLKTASTTLRGVVLLARNEDLDASETDTSRVPTVAGVKRLLARLIPSGRIPSQPPTGTAGQNQVWKTNAGGVPGWRTEQGAPGTPGPAGRPVLNRIGAPYRHVGAGVTTFVDTGIPLGDVVANRLYKLCYVLAHTQWFDVPGSTLLALAEKAAGDSSAASDFTLIEPEEVREVRLAVSATGTLLFSFAATLRAGQEVALFVLDGEGISTAGVVAAVKVPMNDRAATRLSNVYSEDWFDYDFSKTKFNIGGFTEASDGRVLIPADGVYHLESALFLQIVSTGNFRETVYTRFRIERGGQVIAQSESVGTSYFRGSDESDQIVVEHTDWHRLRKGDKLIVDARGRRTNGVQYTVDGSLSLLSIIGFDEVDRVADEFHENLGNLYEAVGSLQEQTADLHKGDVPDDSWTAATEAQAGLAASTAAWTLAAAQAVTNWRQTFQTPLDEGGGTRAYRLAVRVPTGTERGEVRWRYNNVDYSETLAQGTLLGSDDTWDYYGFPHNVSASVWVLVQVAADAAHAKSSVFEGQLTDENVHNRLAEILRLNGISVELNNRDYRVTLSVDSLIAVVHGIQEQVRDLHPGPSGQEFTQADPLEGGIAIKSGSNFADLAEILAVTNWVQEITTPAGDADWYVAVRVPTGTQLSQARWTHYDAGGDPVAWGYLLNARRIGRNQGGWDYYFYSGAHFSGGSRLVVEVTSDAAHLNASRFTGQLTQANVYAELKKILKGSGVAFDDTADTVTLT